MNGDVRIAEQQPTNLLPPGMTVHSTPAELRVRARLGYETVEPTIMSYLMVWVLLIFGVIMAYAGYGEDVPKRFDVFFFASLAVFGLIMLAANVLNRAHLHVDAGGITAGIRPVPANGFAYHRRIPLHSIAGIYVAQCDLWVRLRAGLFRSFEVHALTTEGEPVCLLQRIPQASTAADLAIEIRKRLGVIHPAQTELRGRMRSGSERSFQFAGFLPAWSFWLGMLLIGLEVGSLPLVRVAGWERVPAKVLRMFYLHHGRRSCTVTFDIPTGPVSARVENHCSSGTSAGDTINVFYNPTHPATARILTMPLLPVALMFGLVGAAALIFGRERLQFVEGRRILWQDKFRYLSRYWHLKEKENAEAAKGTFTVWGLSGTRVLPYTESAFEPGALELRAGTGQRAGRDDGAGILFAASYDGIGYVFGIDPQLQTAFARRVGRDWSVDLMPATFVREINAQPGDWNTLRVEIAGNRAHFLVNGARAGSVDYEPPMGGGMVGIYAEFGGSQTVWQFSGLVVLA